MTLEELQQSASAWCKGSTLVAMVRRSAETTIYFMVLYCACCSHELLLLTQQCRMDLVWASHAMAVVHLHLATRLQLS